MNLDSTDSQPDGNPPSAWTTRGPDRATHRRNSRRFSTRTPLSLAIGLLATTLVIAGCSGSSKPASQGSPEPATNSASGGSEGGSTGSGSGAPHTGATSTDPNGTTSSPSTPDVGPAGGAVPAAFKPYSVTYTDTMHGWVLGTAPCSQAPCTSIVRTRDGGATWTGIPAPKAPLPTNDGAAGGVTNLRFADQSNGWAYGYALYSTHDGGATWRKQALGNGQVPAGPIVEALETSGGYAWAAISSSSCASANKGPCTTPSVRVYRSKVGSDSWTAVGSAVAGPVGGANTLVAHGSQVWLTQHDDVYTTTGGALTKLTQPCAKLASEPDGAGPSGLAVADATHLDVLCEGEGAAGSARKQLVGSSNGGKTWKPSGPSRVTESGSFGITDNAAGVLLTSDASGASTIFRTTNDGQSFSSALSSTAAGGGSWQDLGFTTTNQAVVVLKGYGLYQSTDAGAHWTKKAFTQASSGGVSAGSTGSGGGSTGSSGSPHGLVNCSTSQLRLSAADLGAGNTQQTIGRIVLTNVGSSACVLTGYAGVSLVDGAGTQLNQPAARVLSSSVAPVTLAAGATASTIFTDTEYSSNGKDCNAPQRSVNVRVYPPNQTDALLAPLAMNPCYLSVRPLQAGSGAHL